MKNSFRLWRDEPARSGKPEEKVEWNASIYDFSTVLKTLGFVLKEIKNHLDFYQGSDIVFIVM